MAGLGLPNDDSQAELWTHQAASARRLVWEINADGEGEGRPFVYQDRMAQVRRLVDRYPQIEGVLLDDMSTLGIDRGFQPEHIRQIRELLPGKYRSVQIWGVVYTMSLGRERINDYIQELDVINLWTWHAQDVVDLEKNVAHCERLFPQKPIVVGLYLYDYGGGRRFPLDLLETQCRTALRLAHEGRIEGMVFLTINNDPEAVGWVAHWIQEVGDQEIGSVDVPPQEQEKRFTTRLPGSWPTWIEGPNDTILMSFNAEGKVHIATSRDEGQSWEVASTIQVEESTISGGYFTRLSEETLLLTITRDEPRQVGWIRSDDHGQTWSEPTPILPLVPHLYPYGPILVMPDGRWAYCPYYQREQEEFRALLVWSGDQGKTWSEPIAFPTPTDGNQGLTECTVVQTGPGRYLAAIRGDEGPGNPDAFDGFYFSRSENGLQWSAPEPLNERGRMPLFYRIGDSWVLAYRQYDFPQRTQHSVLRFSREGQEWSEPLIIESGVNAGPQLVQVQGKILAFNTLYPETATLTRHEVNIPDEF
jgi:hypothetical protein